MQHQENPGINQTSVEKHAIKSTKTETIFVLARKRKTIDT